jgi:hypothetical protein
VLSSEETYAIRILEAEFEKTSGRLWS